ncbi:MAG: Plug domain-containing protein, partial [Pseudomonadales bacterium]
MNTLLAATIAAVLAPTLAIADRLPVIEVTATAQKSTREDIALKLATPDTALALKSIAGADVNQNGPLTGIQQYRGLYGPRVAVSIDGIQPGTGGPNWMDPPLSYAPAALLDSLTVYRGIAPVSA